ncbi:Cdc40, partial [Symbiodinium necroappetens]
YWDTETGQIISTFTNKKTPFCVSVHPDPSQQNVIVTGCSNKKAVQWDSNTCTIVQEYDEHMGAVNTATICEDGKRLLTSSDDKKMFLWEFGIPVVVKHIAEPTMHSIPQIVLSPDEKYLIGQSMDNKIIAYEAFGRFKFIARKTFKGHLNSGYAITPGWSADGKWVMSGDADGKLWFWDWGKCKNYRVLKAHDGVCTGCLWYRSQTGNQDDEDQSGNPTARYSGRTEKMHRFLAREPVFVVMLREGFSELEFRDAGKPDLSYEVLKTNGVINVEQDDPLSDIKIAKLNETAAAVFQAQFCCYACSSAAPEWATTALMDWKGDEARLGQLCQLFQLASSPDNSIQQQVMQMLSQFSQLPDFDMYLATVFAKLTSQDEVVRQRAGLLLKTNLGRAQPGTLQPAIAEYVQAHTLSAVSDSSKVIRHTAGTVISILVLKVGFVGSRQTLDKLATCLADQNPHIVEGSFNALNKICEDGMMLIKQMWDYPDEQTQHFVRWSAENLLPKVMQMKPASPALSRARTGPGDEVAQLRRAEVPKRALRTAESFNERAPPLWLVGSGPGKAEDDDDACSSADSVRSGYQEQDASEQPATPQSPASHGVSSSSEGTPSDMRKAPRMSDVKKDKGELPAVAGAERRPASGSSARDSLRSPQGTSPPAPGVQSTVDQVEAKVNASTAGEWVNKLKALQDVAEEHSSCACRIMGHVEDMFPEAREFSSSTKSKIVDEIYLQLELSRELLERHAQGLIGTDLAELKMMKAEYKRLDDRLARMNKLFAKEVSSLRDLLQKKKEGVGPTAPPKSSYEPLMFMEPAQRGWLLGLLEEKLEGPPKLWQPIAAMAQPSSSAGAGPLFRTRPTSSVPSDGTVADILDARARRREAYNSRRSSCPQIPCRSQSSLSIVEVVLCPLLLCACMLRAIFHLLWTSLTGLLHCMMHLHFLLGAVAAFAVIAAASWQLCTEVQAPAPSVHVVCRAESPAALQVRDVARTLSTSISLNWAWLTNIVTEFEHRVSQLLLRGQCPYRTPEEAREACLSRPDSLVLRRASDCSTLRKAYYDGQKQVHPDRLRLLHPACDTEVLQALLEANPGIERRVNTAELARLRDLFKKEEQSSLERKVAKLNEEDQAARKQIAVLEAYNEKLKLEIRKIDDSGSSTSTLVDGLAPEGSASLLVVKQTSGSSAAMSPPAGKPKTGRPKRGATFTRAGSGEEVAAQAVPECLYASPQAPLHARQNAIECLNHFALNWAFHEPKFPALQPFAGQYIEVLGVLANDQDANVLKDVCKGFVCVIENQWSCITEHLANVVLQYMLKACKHPEYVVRVEALEVWTPCTNSAMLVQCVWSLLNDLIPVLLDNMVYSQADYLGMDNDIFEDDNAAVPDDSQDIRPRNHKPSACRRKSSDLCMCAHGEAEPRTGRLRGRSPEKLLLKLVEDPVMAAAAAKQIMSVTKSAASRLGTLMARHSDPNAIGVRIGLRQRGCNGMSYTMDYTDKVNKFDEVVEADGGIKVVVDSKAVMFLIGTEMDFVSNEVGNEFVFNNPNKKSECGCGQHDRQSHGLESTTQFGCEGQEAPCGGPATGGQQSLVKYQQTSSGRFIAAMVIPIPGGIGTPLMGPPPAIVAQKFKIIKACIVIMIVCTCGQLLAGALLGQLGDALLSSLNLILNTFIGIWMLKDDPLIGKIFDFLARSCCGTCAEQCQGGMTCLMPFIICNIITVLLQIILSSEIQLIIRDFKVMLNAVSFYDAFRVWLLLVSTVGALLAQIIGSIYGYLAYREVRDSGVTMSGGDWSSGGTAYPQARESHDEMPRDSRPAANFQAFQGSGQPLVASKADGKEEEDDDDEEAAKFVHPIDEVGDHNLNDDEKAWIQQDSDEGDMIFQLETLPSLDNDCDGDEEVETADGFNVWMRKLEDLRDKLRHESRGDVRAKPSVDELLGQLRQALKDGNWLPLTAARAVPRSSDVIRVVRNLSRQETLETLRALVARHEHPPEQPNSSMWINFVLDYEVHDLHGSAELRSILRFRVCDAAQPAWFALDRDMVQFKILGPGIQPASQTPVQTELRINGSDEVLVVPIVTSTKVLELKQQLAMKLGVDPDSLQFATKAGCSWRMQMDHEEVRRQVNVKGIKSFKPERTKYEDPFLIIGAGHIGLRHGLFLLQNDHPNFIIVDRRDKVGGTSWISQANKTSKLQTELGTYHLQYDEQNPVPKDMATWPSRDELLDHFAKVSSEYGLMPYIQLETNVKAITVNGNSCAHGPLEVSLEATQNYTGVLPPEPTGKGVKQLRVSSVFMYPGNLSFPRQDTYLGEDLFGGMIEYAMFDTIDYDQAARGKDVMIAGHGAFGVENIRTCCEFSAKRIYMVCRRTNLACPRVSSWFCNQSHPAIPASLFLESMEPAYKLIGYDPWSYHSVTYNSARTSAQISQKARFGIGDVYFLALSMGKCEVIVDEVKRLSEGRVHLQSGRELSVQTILKVFGFVGDQEVDRLLKIKSMYGYWADADNRRFTASENPGVYASNFGGTSLSPGAIFFTLMASHVMWFPRDWQRLVDSAQLPTNKRDDSISRCALFLGAESHSNGLRWIRWLLSPGCRADRQLLCAS